MSDERVDLVPTSDPEKRRALRQITAEIQRLKGETAAVLYELGTLLRRVEDEELWRAGDFTSFTDYLDEEADVARSTARRCIEVVRHFNLDLATRYGFDKLFRGLRYLEVTRREEQPGDLIAADLRLRGPGGHFVRVPFHEATGRQIEEAIQLEAGRRGAAARRPPEALADRLDRLTRALPAPPKGVRAAKRRVEVTRAASGQVALTFRQVPLAELRAFLDAVERELLDEEGAEVDTENGDVEVGVPSASS